MMILEQMNEDSIVFRGHKNILGLHRNTIELTTEDEISRRADCIIGVSADKACSQLKPALKSHITRSGKLAFEIRVERAGKFEFFGYGSKDLSLSNPVEIVFRKSDFSSPRTGAIRCNAAASDIPREMIGILQSPESRGVLIIRAIDEFLDDQINSFRWNLP